jgi:hypothetical protein
MGLWSDPETMTLDLKNLTAEVVGSDGEVYIMAIPFAEMLVQSWIEEPVIEHVGAAPRVRSTASIVLHRGPDGSLYTVTKKDPS